MNCKKRVKIIYDNWIQFMGYISREKRNGLNIESIFWLLDKFVFDSFFSSNIEIEVFIVAIDIKKSYDPKEIELITKCISPDRDLHHRLKNSNDKEFISTLVSGNKVYLMYYPSEVMIEMQPKPQHIPNNDFNDIQLKSKLVPDLSINKSVVNELDSSSIGVNSISNSNLLLTTTNSAALDKRLIVLGSQRALYNSVVETHQIDMCQENLHSMGEPVLRLALMTFHAMIHIKTAMVSSSSSSSRSHSNEFLKQFVNHIPSVLFGHYMFPPMTINDQ